MTSEETKAPKAAAGEERKEEGGLHMPQLPLPGMGCSGICRRACRAGCCGGGAGGARRFDVVDWPVAIFVGAGFWVAEQYARAAVQGQRGERREAGPNMPSPAG